MPYTPLPAAAAARGVKFWLSGRLSNYARYIGWKYGWSGRRYGLLFHDQCFIPNPEVKEAIRRLNLKEPWEYDQREMRILRAHNLAMMNEILPKEEWTQWKDETFYLQHYFDEIEAEKKERSITSGFIPRFLMKANKEEAH